jgi:hypothetical protein
MRRSTNRGGALQITKQKNLAITRRFKLKARKKFPMRKTIS